MVRGQARLSVNPFVGGSFRLVGGVVLCGVAPVVMHSCAFVLPICYRFSCAKGLNVRCSGI